MTLSLLELLVVCVPNLFTAEPDTPARPPAARPISYLVESGLLRLAQTTRPLSRPFPLDSRDVREDVRFALANMKT